MSKSNGDKYVLTFNTGDKTPVPQLQEIYKLWLENKRKTDDGSGTTDRIAAAISPMWRPSVAVTASYLR